MSFFDENEVSPSAPPSTGFGSPGEAVPQRPQKVTSAPSWILFISLVCSLAAAVVVFLFDMSMVGRLIPWLIAVLSVMVICAFLFVDGRARGAGRYATKSTDTLIFSVAVGLGLAAVVLTSIMFGLFIGRT
ncbi:MAG: hypothetical protein ACTHWM_05355 [Yaniella sp.]|uniref:hypothetical protein n=1 Tax=Yaniella sp. TaxID=2773929 RepID=UPI003F9674F1